jgi:hypothetical protein
MWDTPGTSLDNPPLSYLEVRKQFKVFIMVKKTGESNWKTLGTMKWEYDGKARGVSPYTSKNDFTLVDKNWDVDTGTDFQCSTSLPVTGTPLQALVYYRNVDCHTPTPTPTETQTPTETPTETPTPTP